MTAATLSSTSVDRQDNAHSTNRPAAVDRYDEFLIGYARFSTAVLAQLAQIFAIDPALPMAHCANAYLHLAAGKRELIGVAAAALLALDAQPLNAWESQHRAALHAWLQGDTRLARTHWDRIVDAHPRDFLALKMTQFGHFYAGAREQMRAAVNAALPSWSTASPLHGYLLGMQAFGFEECGDYGRAEAIGRSAVARNGDDVWAVHAVAHCMEMQDAPNTGIAWLDAALHATPGSALQNHLCWHKALMQIAIGDTDGVLADYDAGLYGNSVEYLDICNDVALLARVEFNGRAVDDRWQRLLPRVTARACDQLMAFCDAHYVYAAAAAGNHAQLAQLLSALEAHSRDATTDGLVTRDVGLSLCQAIAARAHHDHHATAELLDRLRHDIVQIGGSNAQRDLFAQLHIDAHVRAGNRRSAIALLNERLATRPGDVIAQQRLRQLIA